MVSVRVRVERWEGEPPNGAWLKEVCCRQSQAHHARPLQRSSETVGNKPHEKVKKKEKKGRKGSSSEGMPHETRR